MPVAALDIGSNSFNLLIAEVSDNCISPIYRAKQKVQLGAGLDADNNLSRQAIERGINCIREYIHLLNEYNVSKITIAATNTLRLANNRSEFINDAEALLMHPVTVISGNTEAQYVYRAIQNQFRFTGSALVIDIGGGSTEIAYGIADNIAQENCYSVQAGCVSYSNDFFADGKIYPENMTAAMARCRLDLESIGQPFNTKEVENCIGTSGTVQSIALLAEECVGKPAEVIERQDLALLIESLLAVGNINAIDFPSVEESRRKILPAGLCILSTIMNHWGIEQLSVGEATLCEGLLLKS